ncbi:hypothetical protein BTA51_14060 [Hahella sp. CCB-MM4]|uniref:hypothetical protein n=1 Tax=Hahella sp. (strain CCB-MM4) TaxID=1926491 RepID=UPI000B9B7C0E|nr:hypothetical protein [Hahella sp. CCB-MM4]OZG72650.1 hypothetical protein BTA51_14060 [Hahella sp. CCB-MM4]
MADDRSGIIELAKYPVLVFSIVVALIIAKFALGLEFGMITEVSTDGLKFSEKSNKATLSALTEIEAKLNDLSVRIEALETDGGNKSAAAISNAQAEAFTASQSVSDATANIAQLNTQVPGNEASTLKGWIWIGNYDGGWTKSSIAELGTGQPLSIDPTSMQPGTEYRVLGNMVARDGLPPNTKEYYRARTSLGIVPRGSVVTLLAEPESVDREFALQYWANIEFKNH